MYIIFHPCTNIHVLDHVNKIHLNASLQILTFWSLKGHCPFLVWCNLNIAGPICSRGYIIKLEYPWTGWWHLITTGSLVVQLNTFAGWTKNIDSFHMGDTNHGVFIHFDDTVADGQRALFSSCSTRNYLSHENPIIIRNVFGAFTSSNAKTQPYNNIMVLWCRY